MEQVLLVVQVLITLALIIVVLIQRSDSDGFGLSGGSGNNLLSGRASASTITRVTAILAALFMANALLLGVLASRSHSGSIVEAIEEQQAEEGAVPNVPAADAVEEKPAPTTKAAPAKVKEKPAVPEADAGDAFDPNAAGE
jgi:preprotein translocase subunit SecG